MSTIRLGVIGGVVASLLGCSTTDPGEASIERGPQGTIAYKVLIESNEPGVRIEANKEYVGTTPLELKIFGDRDGTFHNFGSPHYVIRAIPVKPGQHAHSKFFRTGEAFTGEDLIPKRVFFDMSQPDKTFVEGGKAPRW
ncbi:MAG: hypothetical protein HS113_24415 [Verrucomicrobiales bacterium]|nr:hypothetical protein [Verrucomicrobiales bacterium]